MKRSASARRTQAAAGAASADTVWSRWRRQPPRTETPCITPRPAPSTHADATPPQPTPTRHRPTPATAHASPRPPHRRATTRADRGLPRTDPPTAAPAVERHAQAAADQRERARAASQLRHRRAPRRHAALRRRAAAPRTSPHDLEALGRRPRRTQRHPPHRPSQYSLTDGARNASSPVSSVSPSVPTRSTAARAIDSLPPPRPPRCEARRPISVSSCDFVRASGTVRSQLAPPSARRFTRSSSSIANSPCLQTHRAFPSATTVSAHGPSRTPQAVIFSSDGGTYRRCPRTGDRGRHRPGLLRAFIGL